MLSLPITSLFSKRNVLLNNINKRREKKVRFLRVFPIRKILNWKSNANKQQQLNKKTLTFLISLDAVIKQKVLNKDNNDENFTVYFILQEMKQEKKKQQEKEENIFVFINKKWMKERRKKIETKVGWVTLYHYLF